MRAGIITLFPEMFQALTDYGVSGRAVRTGLVTLQCWNPRDFTTDKHRTVDDRPYGGGPGMLMKTEPVARAIEAAQAGLGESSEEAAERARVIYLSPQGKPLVQRDMQRLAREPALILLCGRYEGVDQRILDTLVDEECSLGDYVISGGELAAMVLLDALIRLQPGALGHEASAQQDSFEDGLLDCPHYTRPEEFAGRMVPRVLLSGDHEAINRWRRKQSLGLTWQKRPDLLEGLSLTVEQRELLDEFRRESEAEAREPEAKRARNEKKYER